MESHYDSPDFGSPCCPAFPCQAPSQNLCRFAFVPYFRAPFHFRCPVAAVRMASICGEKVYSASVGKKSALGRHAPRLQSGGVQFVTEHHRQFTFDDQAAAMYASFYLSLDHRRLTLAWPHLSTHSMARSGEPHIKRAGRPAWRNGSRKQNGKGQCQWWCA